MTFDGLFAENFYALKRMKSTKANGQLKPIEARDKFNTLVLMVLVPYAIDKVKQVDLSEVVFRMVTGEEIAEEEEEKGNEEEEGEADLEDGEEALIKEKQNLFLKAVLPQIVKVLPISLGVFECASFILKILFIFGKTKHPTMPLWLQGIVIARLTGDDIQAQAAAEELKESRLGVVGRLQSRMMSALRITLVGSALLFKVLEWYYSPENEGQRERMRGALISPPPPVPPKPSPSGVRLPPDPSLCPLCHEKRTNPAASSSGVTFCYVCIHRFVLEYGCCPVTRTPCGVTQIRKIFES